MKRSGSVLGLMCMCIVILGTAVAHGQSNGSIVGWGSYVFVEPEALDSLEAVAGSRSHSLGLKSDWTIVAWGKPFLQKRCCMIRMLEPICKGVK